MDSKIPVKYVSAYIYKDFEMGKILDKIISDENGKIKINFSESTVIIKLNMEGHDDVIKNLVCINEFRTQSMKIFSVVDSSVGVFEDQDTKLTIVDLGTFYGIGGNGTIPDTIKVYRDNILWKTTTKETGIAPSTSHSEWQLPQTFFFNELPGRYKIILTTHNTETLVFEFFVKQIIKEYEKNNLDVNVNNKDEAYAINSKLAPLKQITNGIHPRDVICTENLQLVFKITDDSPVCVKLTTMKKLIERNWAKS